MLFVVCHVGGCRVLFVVCSVLCVVSGVLVWCCWLLCVLSVLWCVCCSCCLFVVCCALCGPIVCCLLFVVCGV